MTSRRTPSQASLRTEPLTAASVSWLPRTGRIHTLAWVALLLLLTLAVQRNAGAAELGPAPQFDAPQDTTGWTFENVPKAGPTRSQVASLYKTVAWYMGASGALADFDFFVSVPLAAWQLGSVGDYNLDGHDDLMWYATADGSVVRWLMHGRHVAPTTETVSGVGTGWQMVP